MKQWLQKLSWTQRNALLTGVLAVFSWLIYTNAVSLTVQLAAECDALQQKIDSAENVSVEIEQLEAELARFNQSSGEESYVTHEQLLDLVSGYCEERELIIRDFPATLNYRRDEWNVEIHRITVQGSYAEIVQLLEFLHRQQKGKIVSVDFFSKIDNKTKIKSLLTTIYVQCISESQT